MNDRARQQLAEAGFDLVHAFDPAALAGEPGLEPVVAAGRPLGWIVGNTRALWPRFLAARRADPELAASADPLDRYTERAIASVLAGTDARAWFAHRRYGEPAAFLPMQRLAVAAGMGALAPTQLVIHPVYGPWFALRAVIVGEGARPASAVAAPPCRCGEACRQAFERATAARGPEAWRAWLAVRDACPVGREHRYGEDQLAYHYTKMTSCLK